MNNNDRYLFRAKRKDNNEWVYGSLIYDVNKKWYIHENNCALCIGFHEVIPETVGQYTGLDDKNGKKIFEGDIVKNEQFTLIVVYNSKQTKFALMYNEMFIDQCSDTLSDCDDIEEIFVSSIFKYKCGSYEVIGNIHDNPELLDKEVK